MQDRHICVHLCTGLGGKNNVFKICLGKSLVFGSSFHPIGKTISAIIEISFSPRYKESDSTCVSKYCAFSKPTVHGCVLAGKTLVLQTFQNMGLDNWLLIGPLKLLQENKFP